MLNENNNKLHAIYFSFLKLVDFVKLQYYSKDSFKLVNSKKIIYFIFMFCCDDDFFKESYNIFFKNVIKNFNSKLKSKKDYKKIIFEFIVFSGGVHE